MPSAHGKSPTAGARRLLVRNKRIERAKVKNNFSAVLFKISVPFLIILMLFLFVRFTTKEWNGHDKVGLVYKIESGDVGVIVADPETPELTTFLIPGDTQVEVASGYGTLRLKNVWQLGFNEKRKGELLSASVTRNFLMPVHLWSDSDAQKLSDGSMVGVFEFIFLPKKTNMAFGDRLMFGIFVLKTKNIEKTQIDLAKSQFLRKETLKDGTPGYVLGGLVSGRLTAYFSDNDIADKNIRFGIIDGSGVFGEAAKVAEIIEVLGGKVVSLEKNQVGVSGICEVSSKNVSLAKKVAKIFGCTFNNSKTNLDLEISLGDMFSKNF